MDNFNFVHHPEQHSVINLNEVCYFRRTYCNIMKHYSIVFVMTNDTEIKWTWKSEAPRNKILNVLVKLASQNLYTEEFRTDDPQQTCPPTQEQNSEKHQPHPDSNPF